MYSVLRITDSKLRLDLLEEYGKKINRIADDKYSGIRKAKDGFSIEISSNDDCKKHIESLICFVESIELLINDMKRDQFRVTFDLAIEPEDNNSIIGNVIRLESSISEYIGRLGIDMEISEYK